MCEISQTEICDEAIALNLKSTADFPALQQYGIPRVKTCIQSELQSIYSHSQADVIGANLFNLDLYEVTCSLMTIP
jgi:hypothetical protein